MRRSLGAVVASVAVIVVLSPVANAVDIGVYRGAGRTDRVAKWEDTYNVKAGYALDYTKRFWNPRGEFMLDKLKKWKNADYKVSFGVTPRWGDIGRYRKLAKELPADTLVRLGWEFNGAWNYYSVDPARFA
jgi:hypothetical protein